MSIFATIEEAVVNRLFPILPTWFIRLCLRWYLVYIGWQTRRGDVVVQQIEVDRRPVSYTHLTLPTKRIV